MRCSAPARTPEAPIVTFVAPILRILALAVVVTAVPSAVGMVAPDALAGTCPDIRFLTLDGQIYRGEPVPPGADVQQGDPVGSGQLDAPTSDDRCERGASAATAVGLIGIAPAAAVAVQGQPGWIYVLGYRCEGFEAQERLTCLSEPLQLDGGFYARRYPAENGPPVTFTAGEPAGEAEIAGEAVTLVAIDGVDPRVAVGVEGRPDLAYVASASCLYVAADNRPRLDGFGRCLRSPVWLLFDPPLERTAQQVVARGDRPLAPELDGSAVLLVQAIGGDALPADLSAAVPIGVLAVDAAGAGALTFDVPDVDEAVYEAVVRCERCAPADAGQAAFPAGVFIVTEKVGGFGSAARVGLMLVLLLLAAATAFVLYRRSRRPRGRPGAPVG